MDVLYEESAVNSNAKKGEKKYKVYHVISMITGVIAVLAAIFCLWNFIPTLLIDMKNVPAEDVEELQAAIAYQRTSAVLLFMVGCLFGGIWFFCFSMKRRVNVSYDYTFVSGELRIAKVFNVNKRKLLYRIAPEDVIQLGDIDNQSFERLLADPSNKRIVCTSNDVAGEGKFFMYVYCAESSGRKLYVLECREELLINMLKFVKRGTLEPDYVMQEKKR